ncbi:MAG TPA: GDP-mannose 4,6-dehydratase [Candidatus Deferrimicrobium sp.]|nr:GDP-mannose 4,6-dehydratase [Candidatus Deferrimicrobium sp.]
MSTPRAFITGISGFAGSYLAEELLAGGYDIGGSVYPNESTANLSAIIDRVSLVTLDILDANNCAAAVAAFKPDYIFHLAAASSVGQSFEKERLTYQTNIDGTLNVLAAAITLPNLRKVIYVGSAECYGIFRPKSKTLTEEQPFNPISPYGIAKAAAEQASLYYCRKHGLPVSVARSFNHSGPRQAEHFVIPSFARQVAQIEAGLLPPVLSVGDLSVKRDLSDVRDIVRGYRLMAEKGRVGRVYHLCSGRAVSIQSVVNVMLKMSSKKIRVRVDPSRRRQIDIPILRGDNSRAVQELGYKARYRLQTTIMDTLDYWRDQIRQTPRP